MSREDKKARTIAFVTYPGLTLLELVATKPIFDGVALGSRFRTVSVGERTDPMDSDTPMAFVPEKAFEEVPDPFALIVPGGGKAALEAMGNERLLNYLRFAAHRAEMICSVSTGAFVLAAAGLLGGRQATTHPAYAGFLEKLGVNYVQRPWIEDGRFVTASGVSGGIDMALHLAARLKSEKDARFIQLIIEYDPEPPFGGIDWSEVNASAQTLHEHGTDLKRALAGRPDLYQKLFG